MVTITESLRKIENQLFEDRNESHDLVGAYLSEDVDKEKLWKMLKNNNIKGIVEYLERDDLEYDVEDFEGLPVELEPEETFEEDTGFVDAESEITYLLETNNITTYQIDGDIITFEDDTSLQAAKRILKKSGFHVHMYALDAISVEELDDDLFEELTDDEWKEYVHLSDYFDDEVSSGKHPDSMKSVRRHIDKLYKNMSKEQADKAFKKERSYEYESLNEDKSFAMMNDNEIKSYMKSNMRKSDNEYLNDYLDKYNATYEVKNGKYLIHVPGDDGIEANSFEDLIYDVKYTLHEVSLNESLDDRIGQKYKNQNGVEIEIQEPDKNGRVQFCINDNGNKECRDTDSYETLDKILNDNGYKLQ